MKWQHVGLTEGGSFSYIIVVYRLAHEEEGEPSSSQLGYFIHPSSCPHVCLDDEL